MSQALVVVLLGISFIVFSVEQYWVKQYVCVTWHSSKGDEPTHASTQLGSVHTSKNEMHIKP